MNANKSFQPTKPFVTALAGARPAPNDFAAEADVRMMRGYLMKVFRGLCLIWILSLFAIAEAAVNLEVVQVGDSAEVSLWVLDNNGDQYVGYAITRQIVGMCAPPEVVSDAVVPFPVEGGGSSVPGFTDSTLTFSLPHLDVVYRFEAHLVDEGGELHPVPYESIYMPPPVPHDYLVYGDGVIMRGDLVPAFNYPDHIDIMMEPCADGCWGASPVLVAQYVTGDHPLVLCQTEKQG